VVGSTASHDAPRAPTGHALRHPGIRRRLKRLLSLRQRPAALTKAASTASEDLRPALFGPVVACPAADGPPGNAVAAWVPSAPGRQKSLVPPRRPRTRDRGSSSTHIGAKFERSFRRRLTPFERPEAQDGPPAAGATGPGDLPAGSPPRRNINGPVGPGTPPCRGRLRGRGVGPTPVRHGALFARGGGPGSPPDQHRTRPLQCYLCRRARDGSNAFHSRPRSAAVVVASGAPAALDYARPARPRWPCSAASECRSRREETGPVRPPRYNPAASVDRREPLFRLEPPSKLWNAFDPSLASVRRNKLLWRGGPAQGPGANPGGPDAALVCGSVRPARKRLRGVAPRPDPDGPRPPPPEPVGKADAPSPANAAALAGGPDRPVRQSARPPACP